MTTTMTIVRLFCCRRQAPSGLWAGLLCVALLFTSPVPFVCCFVFLCVVCLLLVVCCCSSLRSWTPPPKKGAGRRRGGLPTLRAGQPASATQGTRVPGFRCPSRPLPLGLENASVQPAVPPEGKEGVVVRSSHGSRGGRRGRRGGDTGTCPTCP